MEVIEAAVPRPKVDLYPASVREPKEFESAFSSLAGKRAEALVVYPDGMFVIQLRPKDSGVWNDRCFRRAVAGMLKEGGSSPICPTLLSTVG